MPIPPQVELVPKQATSMELDVDEPSVSSLSAGDNANNALEEKANETVPLERTVLDDVHDSINEKSLGTPGNTINLNSLDHGAKSGAKRGRTDSPPQSEITLSLSHTSKPAGKKPKLAQPSKDEPQPLQSLHSGDHLKKMMLEIKSEILYGIDKHNEASNSALDKRLRFLEDRLEHVDHLLQKVLIALTPKETQEPNTCKLQTDGYG